MNKIKYLCKICNKEQKGIYGFLSHLRWHHPGITTKIYYDKFFKKQNEDVCQTPDCINKTNFYNLTQGYHKHCSRECTKKDPEFNKKIFNSKMKSGIYNNNREKAKKTCIKKYGVENISQIDEVKEKKIRTCVNNNGYEYWVGSDEHKEWMNNGGAAYCNKFISNPSKPQLELYKKILKLCPYAIINYPSLNYSIDIAIPFLNIAIEYDGSYWHNDNHDNKRDEKLKKEGWKIFRFTDRIPNIKELKETGIGFSKIV